MKNNELKEERKENEAENIEVTFLEDILTKTIA